MDPSIGPAGPDHRDVGMRNMMKRRFNLGLDGGLFRLALPSGVCGAVVLQR